jgi:hypothetical protein
MIRRLTKNDANIFCIALDYYCDNTDHVKSGYLPEDRKEWSKRHKEYFSMDLGDDYIVMGDIINNVVVGIAIGFRTGLLLGRQYYSLIPGWHLAFTWKHDKYWASPKQFIFDITNPISLHMENLGVFDFTKIMRVNTLNLDHIGADQYINRVYNKNIPDGRYNAYAEYIVRTEDDLKKLPVIMQKIYPSKITKPLMCIKHSLKNELRNNYLVNKKNDVA